MTKHKENCMRVFKNYDKTCDRCQELMRGSEPRKGWQTSYYATKRKEVSLSQRIASHDCKASNCGVVCTAFDW